MTVSRVVAVAQKPVKDFDSLAVAHGMLVAAEQILCPMRLMLLFKPQPQGPVAQTNYWYLYFATAGAVGELRARLLKHPRYRTVVGSFITSTHPALTEMLGRLTATDCAKDVPLAMCMRIRDKYWAHWDRDVSDLFMRARRLDGTDPPVAETEGDYSIESTGIPWVREAWFADMEKAFSLDESSIIERTKAMTHLFEQAAMLAKEAAIGIMQTSGIDLTTGTTGGSA